jgi:arginyl-tRNA synthetase
MNAGNPQIVDSRLKIAKTVRDVLKLMLNLLGIESLEVMLKA